MTEDDRGSVYHPDGQLPLRHWGWQDWSTTPTGVGYNSRTWEVRTGTQRCVVKAVPGQSAAKFTAGLEIARIVNGDTVLTGCPLPTATGAITVSAGDWCWALLRYVDGDPIDQHDTQHLALMGATLGRIHTALRDTPPGPGIRRWDDPQESLPDAPFLRDEPWILAALDEAAVALPADLTVGLIHCDPAPHEFRVRRAGVGLLDWGEVTYAPLLFDVATVITHLDDEIDPAPLVSAYLAEAPVKPAEVVSIGPLMKFRSAIEALVYATRAWQNNTTGMAGQDVNRSLLERARRKITRAEKYRAGAT